MKTYIVDIQTKNALDVIDFIPRKDERIILNNGWQKNECVVDCVVHDTSKKMTIVFVNIVEPCYSDMISRISWSLVRG